LIFVKPRFEVYKAVSQQIREIFAEHTPIIEPLSLDEAYLDVTENLQNIPLARDVALAIRAKIKEVTGLNASAGISYNKFLAKLASDHRKPNGQYVITPEMGPAFVEALPVGKFHGIGPATSAKMNSLGLHTGRDMRSQTLEFMQANFGKAGAYYYWISRGVDNREVRANRIRKSVGDENTFSSDLTEFDAMAAELQPLIDKVWRHCEDKGSRGRTVTLKVKFNDFEIITRSRSVPWRSRAAATSNGCRSRCCRTRCPFPSRCASWGFLFLHCKATTRRNRNLASRFEGSVSSGFQETGGARFLGDENGALGLLRIFRTRFCDTGIALVPDLSDRKPPAVLDRHDAEREA
jgi:nucleotidyltransferase/DNA polymerase involved in DNA repair